MHSECAVLYSDLLPVWLYQIFELYLIKEGIFSENVIEHKICFEEFLYNFCPKTLRECITN